MNAVIEPTFWSDPDFDEFSEPLPLYVYLYLISNPSVNALGAYQFSLRRASHDIRMDITDILQTIDQLVKARKVSYDKDSNWMWVHGYFGRQFKVPLSVRKPMIVHVNRMVQSLHADGFPWIKDFESRYRVLLEHFQSSSSTRACARRTGGAIGEEISYSRSFLEFWSQYPKKESKQMAFKSWCRHVDGKVDEAMVIAKAKEFSTACSEDGRERKFIKHPTTWINQHCWDDDYLPHKTTGRSKTLEELKAEHRQHP